MKRGADKGEETHGRTSWRIRLALGLVLAAAVVLRVRGIDFGLPAFHDADEPLFMLMGFHLLKEGTLNPGWFGHPGSTTIYAIALVEIGTYFVGHFLGQFADQKAFADAIYADPGLVVLPARYMFMALGLLCVFLTWRLGRRLANWRLGLLGAAFLAVNPLHIQYSQIVRTDIQATVFMLLCVLAALAFLDSGRRRHLFLSGMWCGFGIATKWPAAIVFVCPMLAAWSVSRTQKVRPQAVTWLMLCTLAGIGVIAAMLVASPYLALDYKTVLYNLVGESRPEHISVTGKGFWSNLFWYLTGPLVQSLGIPGAILAAIGAAISGRDARVRMALVALPVLFLIAISGQSLIWPRWILPILPFASLLAALAVLECVTIAKNNLPGMTWKPATAAILLLVIVPMLRSANLDARERMNDTRSQASAWARANIPAGKRIAIEFIGIDMLYKGWTILFPVGEAGCVDAQAAISGKVQFNAADRARGKAMVVNLGTIPENRKASCAADFAMMVFPDRYLAEKAKFPKEAAVYEALMASGTLVKTFAPARGVAGGPIVRIVQFRQ